MDVKRRICSSSSSIQAKEHQMELKRGPWTVEEDLILIDYITNHGEGRWNSLSRSAGLKRTGKSCRLRWLNYLRRDVRRGNITLEEQLIILDLHSRWGNRWSKIAQHLPGRTDNEIKNYWRTRVQKHAKQLKCDVNSKQFKDTMRYQWMPRLIERIQAAAVAAATTTSTGSSSVSSGATIQETLTPPVIGNDFSTSRYNPEYSRTAASSESFGNEVSPVSDSNDYNNPMQVKDNSIPDYFEQNQDTYNRGLDFQNMEQINQWMDCGDTSGNLMNIEDFWVNYNI